MQRFLDAAFASTKLNLNKHQYDDGWSQLGDIEH
jgi:hypothetical protein